jgi:2'-5' RNA ligase
MKTIRTFLALKPDLETVRLIAEEQRELRKHADQAGLQVSWVPPPNMHITIRFLGDVTEPMVNALKDMLEPVVLPFPSFSVEVAGVGVFPDLRRPRVVWVGARTAEQELHRLHGAVSTRLDEAGFPSDGKPFRSHITIGRIRGGNAPAIAGGLRSGEERLFGNSPIHDLICYRSDLKPRGAEYHALWRLPLQRVTRTDTNLTDKQSPQAATDNQGE